MAAQTLLPDPNYRMLDGIRAQDGAIVFDVRTTASTAVCSLCGYNANRLHSRYCRKLLDLPWQGNTVRIQITARKFFCDNRDCKRRIFTEPLPTIVVKYARKTARLADVLRELTYLAGGEVAARIDRALCLLVCPFSRHLTLVNLDVLLSYLKRVGLFGEGTIQ